MRELEMEGKLYQIGKLDPRTQFHVARKLGPALWSFFEAYSKLPKDATVDDITAIAGMKPVADEVAKMSKEDSDTILDACLGACSRKEGGQWMPVWVDGMTPYSLDLTFESMMRLTVEVIKDNMGNFSRALGIPSQ